jgi:hypothetical protein
MMVDPSESKADEMDVEQIMRQLREKIRYSNPDAPDPFPGLSEISIAPQSIPCAPVTDPDLIYINQNYDTYSIVAPSVYRRLVSFIRRRVGSLIEFHGLKQVQFNTAVKQVQYNAAVVRLLNNMTNNIDLINRRLERLEGALEESRRKEDRVTSRIDPGKKVSKRRWNKR